jgi:capsular polysaccharide biosynthesis protein
MANYGFESTDEVKYDALGYPLGKYKVFIKDEYDSPTGIIVEADILTGEHKGTVAKVYYNTLSDNATTAKIAQIDLKRIADATGKSVNAMSPLKGRTFVVEVEPQKKNPQYTNVKAYLPKDSAVDADKAPEAF